MNLAPLDDASTNPLSDEPQQAVRTRSALWFVSPVARIVPIPRSSLVFGREAACDVVLSGGAVSRRHAVVQRRSEVIAIRDEGSRNGVFVNGCKVGAQELLRPGDVVRLGDHVAILGEVESPFDSEFRELAAGLWGTQQLGFSTELASRAAKGTSNVLVLGESGTGKERLAGLIHSQAGRPGSLIAVNCAALSESLLEAELFGYERAAFTGAQQDRPGLVQVADRGTLLLDEVGELSPRAQALLLRVVQEGEVLPVGARRSVRVDVRFVGATHRDLDQMVREGRFRADLLHRLSGVRIRVGPLRERRQDIVPLFSLFLRRALGGVPELGPLLVEALCLHAWPGNVREVQQLAQGLATLYPDLPRWRYEQLPLEFRCSVQNLEPTNERISEPPSTRRRPRQLEPSAITEALAQSLGNIAQAARRLGIARQSLYALIRQHRLDPASYRSRSS